MNLYLYTQALLLIAPKICKNITQFICFKFDGSPWMKFYLQHYFAFFFSYLPHDSIAFFTFDVREALKQLW